LVQQDQDGSHIKGLLINLFHHFWPSLLQVPGFLRVFVTPIVKATRARTEPILFYTIPEYLEWKEENSNGKGWTIKYYKGLGTSSAAEAKQYFSDLDTHQVCLKLYLLRPSSI
jgi:DNA topoisomerase-2